MRAKIAKQAKVPAVKLATLKIETAFKNFYFDIYTWESEEEARKKLDQKIEEIANLIEQA